MESWSDFHGPNYAYLLERYQDYLEDPQSVEPATRSKFDRLGPPEELRRVERRIEPDRYLGVVRLAQAIRSRGHLDASLDPLGSTPPADPTLDPESHGISDQDLRQLPGSLVGGPAGEESENAWEAIQKLRQVYCRSIGYDYGHIRIPQERDWLRQAAESGQFRPPHQPVDQEALLDRLTQVEAFELFLHRIFPGKTRFSIEGLDMLVPMLDEMISQAAMMDICMILIGMAHRGRINILAHVLGKPYRHILAEFKDPGTNFPTRDEAGWTGDVKYHKGGKKAVGQEDVVDLILRMPSNPSHVELVDPVLLGMARAADTLDREPGAPELALDASLPLLIHGDAAFTGEGVVAETLNMSRLPGYQTGGTVHIIANNQLGYTTPPEQGRSTLYASDPAKGYKIPIIHVNADQPIACIEAARTAFAYRQHFNKDFLIDLIGYRRYGHNEGDEPRFTQPVVYQIIDDHPTVREQLAERLIDAGGMEPAEPDRRLQEAMERLQQVLEALEPEQDLVEEPAESPPPKAAAKVETAVELERLTELNQQLLTVPEGFQLNPKFERVRKRRQEIFQDPQQPSVNWATAEELAFATLLEEGIPIRLTGEDVERGTFNQRHAVFHDVKTGGRTIPLQNLAQARASFEIHNSPLTENAALGFEFGYDLQAAGSLVLWEAQYGDFLNNAQAVVDEFIVSSRSKWGYTPALVLLLPHGLEGQGPDHSSARPERILQMAAGLNLRLANPTTAAQYFHLLRRQALLLETDPLPLFVMTPKGLLRHPLVASSPKALAQRPWKPVLDDSERQEDPDEVRQVLLCSGRISVDLRSAEGRSSAPDTTILRLEQVYPFPEAQLRERLDRYTHLERVTWVQEEPINLGFWPSLRRHLQAMRDGKWRLGYLSRRASPSPAEGSTTWHKRNQAALIDRAFKPEGEIGEERIVEGEL